MEQQTEKDPFTSDIAEAISYLTYAEIDELVDAMFAKSDTMPYTFMKAMASNLKIRERTENEMLDLLR
tara:strand:- start:774 stop:977 length:204 start_codon:yes stop_codon:yes gene_type:complete